MLSYAKMAAEASPGGRRGRGRGRVALEAAEASAPVTRMNATEETERGGKRTKLMHCSTLVRISIFFPFSVFSMFNIVTFRNAPCTSTQNT